MPRGEGTKESRATQPVCATSAVATVVAGDKRFAWIAGGLILALSIPSHLYPGYVWDDYPAWYHIVYLLSILPIAVFAGRSVQRLWPGICLRPGTFLNIQL